MALKFFQFLKFSYEFAQNTESKIISCSKLTDTITEILRNNNILLSENQRILEIGSGIGNFLGNEMSRRGFKVTCIDVYETRISLIHAIKSLCYKSSFREKIKNFIRILFLLKSKKYMSDKNISTFKTGMDNIPVKDDFFDGSLSVSVLEHVNDLSKGFSELKRVMKNGGWGMHFWHPFTSLTGGHVKVDYSKPWDHLLGNKLKISHGLNKIRYKEMIKLIEKNFKILKIEKKIISQWEKYLTQDIKNKLSDYEPEELLTESFCILFVKIE